MTARLDSFLETERLRIEAALQDAVVPGADPVARAVRYAVSAGGKRLRPILCVAGYRAIAGQAPADVYRLAAALELIHGYSLIHDDLPSMDDDAVRRGRPATHVAHGVATATVAAGAMIPRAVRVADDAAVALGLGPATRTELVRTLCIAAGGGGMVAGQLLDLEAEGRGVEVAELERIHRLKTGALIRAAPLMGGIAAGADDGERTALADYGASLGLAFQVMDDILDVTGSSDIIGKTPGRDTELDKATYPALEGVDGARRRAAAEVDSALAALAGAGIRSDELTALARYAVERDR